MGQSCITRPHHTLLITYYKPQLITVMIAPVMWWSGYTRQGMCIRSVQCLWWGLILNLMGKCLMTGCYWMWITWCYSPSGLPTLPRGIVAVICTVSNGSILRHLHNVLCTLVNISLGTLSLIGVSIKPGKIALHLIPFLMGDNNLYCVMKQNVFNLLG